jgi:Protein of unknown function (DUF3631)
MALCPAHADSNASLSLKEENGRILLHCFAGCTFDTVLAALKVNKKELFSEGPPRKRKPRIVAAYDYKNERGTLLYQNVRYEPKDFRLRQPNGKGRWTWSVECSLRTIYNLPAVIAAKDVIWTEGEKDAETANLFGLTGTTAGSSSAWQDHFAGFFAGKRVVVIADADECGRKHARTVARSLYGKVESLKVLELPDAKDLSEWIELGGGTTEALANLIKSTPEWKPELLDGAELLTDVYRFVRRFVSLPEPEAILIALWVLHTHCIDASDVTPYLAISSAEKQCGKTRLLEVLQTLVAEPWFTGRVTAAVLVRKVDDRKPTLLLDESDAAFGGEKEYAEALRGILNTGHRRGGVASLVVGKGAEMSYKDFSTFCPKAIAGIGRLPDTVVDRSILIRLKRAARGEVMERFRLRNLTSESNALRDKLERWARSVVDHLREARPALPDELSDRPQDGVEPLLAIADLVGKGWSAIARAAIIELCKEARQSDGSNGIRLLSDIRHVFESHNMDKIPSVELVDALVAIETSPWTEWSRGKPLTAPKLARLLRPFDVSPHTIRVGDRTFKGYELVDFEDSFRRYLPAQHSLASKPSHPSQPKADAGFCDFFETPQNQNGTVQKSEIANTDAGCDGVTISTAPRGMEGQTGKQPVEEVL